MPDSELNKKYKRAKLNYKRAVESGADNAQLNKLRQRVQQIEAEKQLAKLRGGQ